MKEMVRNFLCSLILGMMIFGGAAFADDHGNTCGSATQVSVNSNTTWARMDSLGDIDYFRVDVPSSGTLNIRTSGSSVSRPAIDTYGSLKNSQCVEVASGDDSTNWLGQTVPDFDISQSVSAGTYYIAVSLSSKAGSSALYYTSSYDLRVSFAVPDEHGNTCSSATAVNLNSTSNGNIESAGDYDYFSVNVTSSGTLTIYTTGSTDTEGYLKNSACGDLASNDDASSSDRNFSMSRAVTAGTYYVAVKHHSSTGTGTYTLNVDFSGSTGGTDDHGNSCSTATAVSLNSSRSGNIETAGDYDYFSVSVTASGTLTVSSTGGTDTFGYLKNSACTDLASDDDAGEGSNFSISRAVTAGTYYVAAKHYRSTGTGTYTLNVNFSGSTGGTDDHGNSCSTATAVSLNSSRSGNIETAGDYDYFSVNVTQSGTLTVSTTGSTDTYGYLKNSSCNDLESDDDDGESTNFSISRSVTAGTYYVAVKHYNTGKGAYTLNVNFSGGGSTGGTDDHGDTCSAATAVSLNSTRSGNLEADLDIDWFRVDVTRSGTLTVYTADSVTDTYGCLYSGLYVPCAYLLECNDDGDGSLDGGHFRISKSVSVGTYYVAVRGFLSSTRGVYTLHVDFQ